MGASSRIFIRHKEVFVLGQYCSYDGDIEGQGLYLLNFLRSDRNIRQLKKGLEHTEYITDDDALNWKWKLDQKLCKDEDLRNAWLSFQSEVGDSLPREIQEFHPSVHPCTGASILKLISGATNKQKVLLVKELYSIGCFYDEWTYVVDLDKERLEVYRNLEEKKPGHMFFNYYPDQDKVPGFVCAYTFAVLECLSEREFIEYHKKSREDGQPRTLELTRTSRGLFQQFRIQKQWRQKQSRQMKQQKKERLLSRLLPMRGGRR